MIDFIVKYWVEILLTSITSGILYIFKQYIGLNLLMLGIYCIVYIIKKYLIKRVMHKKQK